MDKQTSHALSMIRLFMGYIPTRVIYAAAKLGFLDEIEDGGATADVVAERLGLNASALYRLMRSLAGLGVLHQDGDDRFHVTPFGETLRTGAPNSVKDYAIYSHETVFDAFKDISDSVRTGEPVIKDFFQLLRENPEQAALFHAGMGNRGRIETAAILDAYDFGDCKKVVDVGGGNGAFLSAIMTTQEQMAGTLFDQPSAIDAAKDGRGGALPRCELVSGDFFDTVPSGGDGYILKRVLFDWTDEETIQILKNCRNAMENGTRLFIIEPLIEAPNEESPAHLYDITFLVMLSGRIRTADEYTNLLGQSGFQFEKIRRTESDVSILMARAQ